MRAKKRVPWKPLRSKKAISYIVHTLMSQTSLEKVVTTNLSTIVPKLVTGGIENELHQTLNKINLNLRVHWLTENVPTYQIT